MKVMFNLQVEAMIMTLKEQENEIKEEEQTEGKNII